MHSHSMKSKTETKYTTTGVGLDDESKWMCITSFSFFLPLPCISFLPFPWTATSRWSPFGCSFSSLYPSLEYLSLSLSSLKKGCWMWTTSWVASLSFPSFGQTIMVIMMMIEGKREIKMQTEKKSSSLPFQKNNERKHEHVSYTTRKVTQNHDWWTAFESTSIAKYVFSFSSSGSCLSKGSWFLFWHACNLSCHLS